MHPVSVIVASILPLTAAWSQASHGRTHAQEPFNSVIKENSDKDDPIPYAIREHWMKVARSALYAVSPCPFAAFGTAIVNHTVSLTDASNLGTLICTGFNNNSGTGNPTLHGEMAAFNNCSNVLTDPQGPYRLNASETLAAWKDLSLYTTAEPCPMCASAIAWAGLREVVYASSIEGLIGMGWGQIEIGSREVVERAWRLGREVKVIGGVLEGEMDGLFEWQFGDGQCPEGCIKDGEGACEVVE